MAKRIAKYGVVVHSEDTLRAAVSQSNDGIKKNIISDKDRNKYARRRIMAMTGAILLIVSLGGAAYSVFKPKPEEISDALNTSDEVVAILDDGSELDLTNDDVPVIDSRILDIDVTYDISAESLDSRENYKVYSWDLFIQSTIDYADDLGLENEIVNSIKEQFEALKSKDNNGVEIDIQNSVAWIENFTAEKRKAISADRFTNNRTGKEFTMYDTFEGKLLIGKYEKILEDCAKILGYTYQEERDLNEQQLEEVKRSLS